MTKKAGGCGCWGRRKQDNNITVMIVGLDNAGKTTLFSGLKGDADPYIVPTVGFQKPATIRHGGFSIRLFDLGGGPRIRGVWTHYYADVHAIMFVVDAADAPRMVECKTAFDEVLQHPRVKGKPILVLANKQDKPAALPEVDIAMHLGLDNVVESRHSVVKCVADPKKNQGGTMDPRVYKGLDWLLGAIRADFDALRTRVQQDLAEVEAEKKRKKEAKLAALANPEAAAAAAAAEPAPAAETKTEADVILCETCHYRPATGRAAVSKWMAVCNECKDALTRGVPPPIPDRTAAAPAPASESTSTSAPASAPAPAAAPSPAPAPAPVDDDVIRCSVCKTEPAVRKSGKLGWQPVCDACDPANNVVEEETSDDAGAAATPAAAPTAQAAVSNASGEVTATGATSPPSPAFQPVVTHQPVDEARDATSPVRPAQLTETPPRRMPHEMAMVSDDEEQRASAVPEHQEPTTLPGAAPSPGPIRLPPMEHFGGEGTIGRSVRGVPESL